ncbi:MAG: CTP synthase [Candidatus Buchananbacteria bacterium]|nr:CTP synthase [Candidatus Buchananbacteria bacterium]
MTAKQSQPKYIFVVGGVMSGVGKGVTASSLGTILQARGYRVTAIKIDPYLNVDAGTMNPIEHGEVFVLDSGLETDQDMGNYERFLNMSLPSDCYMTNGMVYKYVIDKERALGYGGKCVDPVPYICQEITRRINRAVEKTNAEIAIVEIGGTVGEYQNAMFIEAARIMKIKHPKDVAFVLVSYLPVPGTLGEMKTKPTQYAVRTLNSNGVHPDIIIARATRPLDRSRKEKIALSSNVGVEDIISAPDVSSIYDIPLNFEKDKLSTTLLKLLSLRPRRGDLKAWKQMVQRQQTATKTLPIAIIGKYFRSGDYVLSDAYISVIEAIKHAGMALKVKPEISWLTAEEFEDPKNLSQLKQYAGIIVPGGFGERGIEGKLNAIRFAREHKIPYFGLCYGMQLLVIEYARNVAKIKDAQTTEIDPKSKAPVIDIMPEQRQHLESGNFGGSMRLGSYLAKIKPNTIAADAYGKKEISERHRHRYEVNPEYIEQITDAGLVFSGTSPDGVLMEIAELPQTEHPFFLGTQFHPEFLSRPLEPHPLFVEFMKAAKGK